MKASTITIIIPTTCELRRWEMLNRAVGSLLSQTRPPDCILILVNGNRFDADCLRQLQERPELKVHYQEEGSLPLALRTARSMVETEFFGFLDDDDEYLPVSLEQRLAAMQHHPEFGLVVCNGYRHVGQQDHLLIDTPELVQADPLAALSQGNWLSSCGALYRSSEVTAECFNPSVSHLEWTYLAYSLSLLCKVGVIMEPGFRVHDTPTSLSKSVAYQEGLIDALEKIGQLPLPKRTQHQVQRRISAAHHDLAEQRLRRGELKGAWEHHVRSLLKRGGWRYFLFARHLFRTKTTRSPIA